MPNNYLINYCHEKSLSNAALPFLGEKCQNKFVNESSVTGATLEDLHAFSEYQITITAKLEQFGQTTQAKSIGRTRKKIRTYYLFNNLTLNDVKRKALR